jgi:hypothetical protein
MILADFPQDVQSRVRRILDAAARRRLEQQSQPPEPKPDAVSAEDEEAA